MAEDVSILDQIENADEQVAVGKGVWCPVTISMSFRSFMKGLDQDEVLQVYDPTKPKTEEIAKAKVEALVIAADGDITNAKERATKCVLYLCHADGAVDRSWSMDLNKVIPTWTQSWRGAEDDNGKVVAGPAKAALQELAEAGEFTKFGKTYFSHVKILADPSGRKDNDGKPEMIWFVDTIYPNEKAMIAAKVELDGEGGLSEIGEAGVPEGWPADVWAQTEPDLLEALEKGAWKKPVVDKLAEEYELDPDFLKSLKPA